MSAAKISLVIPSFNAAETIERTIQSVVDQSYPGLELILVDGGSSDGTMEIVQKYASHFSQIVSVADKGQASALNKGFKAATGEIFAWLCADEEMLSNTLSHVSEMFQKYPEATLLVGACERCLPDGTAVLTKADAKLWNRNGIEQPTAFWKASLHRRAGELDESYIYAFDWDWWNRLKLAKAKVISTDRTLSRFHFSQSSKTTNGALAMMRWEMYRVAKTHVPFHSRLADFWVFLGRKLHLQDCFYFRPDSHPFRKWLSKRLLKLLVRIWSKEAMRRYNFASKKGRTICWEE